MTSKWFPQSRYTEAHRYAVEVARSLGGRIEVGLEKFSEYGRPGYRAGFHLPKAENRYGFEARCEVIKATDPL